MKSMLTTKPGLTVTTTVRVNIVPAVIDDIQVPGDWRMLCDRFDEPEHEEREDKWMWRVI